MTGGSVVLVEDLPGPVRPADLRRTALRRVAPLVPPGFPLQDAVIGLEEAYANILEHAFSDAEEPRLRVEAFWDLRGLNFVLTDRGTRGGGLTLPRPLATTADLKRKTVASGGNLGLILLRRTMSCLCFEVTREGLHRLSMIKFPHQEKAMEEELLVELRVEDDLVRLSLRGYINMDTSDYLAERIRDFLAPGAPTRFLIEAADLEYVSSAGVGVLVDLYDRYENRGGKIAFVGLKAAVRRVLELVGFLGFFGDFSDEPAALEWLRS